MTLIPWVLASSEGSGGLARDLVLVLVFAGVLAVIMHRLKVATIPAYLIGGAIFGSLNLINDANDIGRIGGMSIIFLMFGIGLHMDLSSIRGGMRAALGGTAISLVLCVAGLMPAAALLGTDFRGALVLAIALSMSSTAVVLRVLQQRRQLARTRGRLSMLILIGQDLAVIGVLVALPAIARIGAPAAAPVDGAEAAGHAMSLMGALRSIGLAAGGIAVIFVVGRLVLPRLLAEAALMHSGDVLMVLALAFAIGASATTEHLGLSHELGAFLAGILLSNTNFRHHLAGQIGTVRDLFSAVFFTTLGMSVDLHEIAAHWSIILAVSALVLTIKTIGIAAACWSTGAALVTALNVGLALSQGGEFGLVMMDLASRGDHPILGESTVAMATGVIVVTLIVTPMLFELAERIPRNAAMRRTAPWIRTPDAMLTRPPTASLVALGGEEGPAPGEAPAARGFPVDTLDEPVSTQRHVIIAGFGLVGRAVADRLRPTGASVLIVELNPKTVRDQQQRGRNIIYGDVANPEVLETAGIHHADALILTVPDDEAVLASCKTARHMNPNIFIVARTNVVSKGFLAKGLGADVAVIEELAAAESMERIINQRLRVWKKEDFPDATSTMEGPALG